MTFKIDVLHSITNIETQMKTYIAFVKL